jgi:hypothetical protein
LKRERHKAENEGGAGDASGTGGGAASGGGMTGKKKKAKTHGALLSFGDDE